MKYAIGIDIGGTNSRVALVDEQMTLVERQQFLTDTASPNATLRQLSDTIADMTAGKSVCGIGMSCPGPLDLFAGTIIQTPNLEEPWYGYPLTDKLTELTGLPTTLENDANLAALAEAVIGGGKDARYVQFLTISTGLGSGFVVDKQIYRGAHGFAHEVANACVWQNGPTQGNLVPGGIEAIASGTAITKRAKEAGLDVAHAGEVNDLATAGNGDAKRIIEEAKDYLANFIGILYAVNDPDIVVLGGPVALRIPGFVSDVETRVKTKVFDAVRPYVHLVPSNLNEDCGLIGAAYLAFSTANK